VGSNIFGNISNRPFAARANTKKKIAKPSLGMNKRKQKGI
jgi:hypothetical protein